MSSAAEAGAGPAGVAPVGTASKYYPLFDYLRIVLALGVFASHTDHHFLASLIPQIGNFCVQIFFALSGFLIGGILRDSKADSLPRFYFNRSTRIWIPYFLAILFLAGGCVIKHQPVTAKLAEFFFDKATFSYNFFGPPQLAASRDQMPLQGTGNHFWSICVEEQFYLVAPLLIIGLRGFAVWGILGAGALASWRFPGFFASITLGVLLALSERPWGKWYRHPACLGLGTLALLGLAWACHRYPEHYQLWSPLESVLIVSLMSKTGLSGPAGPFLGGISYPFYLNHWMGLFFIKKVTQVSGSSVVGVGTGLAISLGVSSIHYLVVDRAIHGRRAGWFSRSRGLVCAACGFALVALGIALNLLWHRST